jgi:hypothetical protein
MTTYDPESQAERRRVGGLLQEPLQTEGWGAGAPNFNGGLARKPQSQNFCIFLNRPSATCYCGIEIPHMIGIRTIFDLGRRYERLGIVMLDIRVDTVRCPNIISARTPRTCCGLASA